MATDNFARAIALSALQQSGGETIDQFTNDTLGTIKGSTTAGNISANSDGTGSVSGWGELTAMVEAIRETIGDIGTTLDEINGEVV